MKDCFILAKVNVENLTISAHASVNNRWEEMEIIKDIPLNILDRYETLKADKDMEVEIEDNTL
jgi:hypothetical protein